MTNPRRSIAPAVAAAALLTLGLGCAGITGLIGGGGAASKAACEAYVDHYNGLACLPTDLDKAQICGAVENSPVDMSSYYECLVANTKCKGRQPDIDVGKCTQG